MSMRDGNPIPFLLTDPFRSFLFLETSEWLAGLLPPHPSVFSFLFTTLRQRRGLCLSHLLIASVWQSSNPGSSPLSIFCAQATDAMENVT